MKDGKYYLGIIPEYCYSFGRNRSGMCAGAEAACILYALCNWLDHCPDCQSSGADAGAAVKAGSKAQLSFDCSCSSGCGNWADVFSDFQTVVSGLRSGEGFAGIVCSGSRRGAECICPV